MLTWASPAAGAVAEPLSRSPRPKPVASSGADGTGAWLRWVSSYWITTPPSHRRSIPGTTHRSDRPARPAPATARVATAWPTYSTLISISLRLVCSALGNSRVSIPSFKVALALSATTSSGRATTLRNAP